MSNRRAQTAILRELCRATGVPLHKITSDAGLKPSTLSNMFRSDKWPINPGIREVVQAELSKLTGLTIEELNALAPTAYRSTVLFRDEAALAKFKAMAQQNLAKGTDPKVWPPTPPPKAASPKAAVTTTVSSPNPVKPVAASGNKPASFNLLEARNALKLTQEELAKRVGCSVMSIGTWEARNVLPSWDEQKQKLLEALKITA